MSGSSTSRSSVVLIVRGIAPTSHIQAMYLYSSQIQARKMQATTAANHPHLSLASRINPQLIKCINATEGAIACRRSCTMQDERKRGSHAQHSALRAGDGCHTRPRVCRRTPSCKRRETDRPKEMQLYYLSRWSGSVRATTCPATGSLSAQ